MHSILQTSYFFDEVVEIGLLKVQYLRTASEASLINLFLQLVYSQEESIHSEVCLHCSSMAFAEEKSKCFCLAVPVNTLSCVSKYSIVLKVIFVLKSKMLCCVQGIHVAPTYPFGRDL